MRIRERHREISVGVMLVFGWSKGGWSKGGNLCMTLINLIWALIVLGGIIFTSAFPGQCCIFYYEWDGDFKSNLKMKQFTKTKINHQGI